MKHFFSFQQKLLFNLFQFVFLFIFSLNGMKKPATISKKKRPIIGTIVPQEIIKHRPMSYYIKTFSQDQFQKGEIVGVQRSNGKIKYGKVIKTGWEIKYSKVIETGWEIQITETGWKIQIDNPKVASFASKNIGTIDQEVFDNAFKLDIPVPQNTIKWGKNLCQTGDIVVVRTEKSSISPFWGEIKSPLWLVAIEMDNGKIKKTAWCNSRLLFKLKKLPQG